jgi:hypothetical protein
MPPAAKARTWAPRGQTPVVKVTAKGSGRISIAGGPAEGQVLTAATQPDGTTAWTGVLRLPKPRLLTPYRLVVTEQEQHSRGGKLVYGDVIRL